MKFIESILFCILFSLCSIQAQTVVNEDLINPKIDNLEYTSVIIEERNVWGEKKLLGIELALIQEISFYENYTFIEEIYQINNTENNFLIMDNNLYLSYNVSQNFTKEFHSNYDYPFFGTWIHYINNFSYYWLWEPSIILGDKPYCGGNSSSSFSKLTDNESLFNVEIINFQQNFSYGCEPCGLSFYDGFLNMSYYFDVDSRYLVHSIGVIELTKLFDQEMIQYKIETYLQKYNSNHYNFNFFLKNPIENLEIQELEKKVIQLPFFSFFILFLVTIFFKKKGITNKANWRDSR